MKLKDGLDPEAVRKLNVLRLPEKLSNREWHEIMGTNRDTYKRHRGAVRRK